ncbi:MBL fold metallo-hydrolase [Brevundimonas sp.]|uniref:MBL fold metallo-hydrolase n=1 Tax=Brevundimonas sp. TaxID=1871086 RepID=UPI0035ADA8CE
MTYRPMFPAVALAALIAACSQEADTAPAPEAPAVQTAATDNIHGFRIGEFQAWALRDGSLSFPNDNETVAIGESAEDTDAVLTAAGLPTDEVSLGLQPLLVRMGERTVLFDAGAAGQMGTQGLLPQSLTSAGVEPGQVTDILISHGHGDHVGGLVAGGALAFPNAVIRMSQEEWAALQADEAMAELVSIITPRVETFVAGSEVIPSVISVGIDGHTPGHSGYKIASGEDRLLYIGDTAHHHVISVQRPDWTIAFDGDAPTAEASRRAILQRAADENLRVYAVHFPFPGLGRVERNDDGFVWSPEG